MSRTTVDTVGSLTATQTLPRVNLLPPEVHEARKLRKLQAGLGAGVAVVAVLVGGVYLLAAQSKSDAQDDLATAKAQSVTLEAQKAQFVEVPRILAAIDAAEGARQTAMTTDVQWYRYLNDFSYVTPKNDWLTSLTVTSNQNAATTNPIAKSGVFTMTLVGAGKQHVDVASWLDALAKEKGFADAYFSSSAKVTDDPSSIVKFSTSVTITPDALSHRYDRKAG